MPAAVTSRHNANGLLRVYINGAIHMAFNTTQMANMQSWRDERRPALYSIEVTPKEGTPLLCEYDREELWRDVLGEIDKAFGHPVVVDRLKPSIILPITSASVAAFREALPSPLYGTAVGEVTEAEWRVALEAAVAAA